MHGHSTFCRRSHLVQHLRTHMRENPHKYDNVCWRTFNLRPILVKYPLAHPGKGLTSVKFVEEPSRENQTRYHLQEETHTEEKPHQCNVCGVSVPKLTPASPFCCQRVQTFAYPQRSDIWHSKERRCSRVRVRRVAVPKNIQPARTKCWWTTTLAGKLSSFGLDPRGSSSFSFCFEHSDSVWLRVPRQWPGMPRSANLAGVTNCHPTVYLKWMPRRESRDTNRMGFLGRREAYRSVFKLDHH